MSGDLSQMNNLFPNDLLEHMEVHGDPLLGTSIVSLKNASVLNS